MCDEGRMSESISAEMKARRRIPMSIAMPLGDLAAAKARAAMANISFSKYVCLLVAHDLRVNVLSKVLAATSKEIRNAVPNQSTQ